MHNEVHALTKMTATKLAKKWKQDRDDIAQELYLWILTKLDYSFFEEYLDADDYDGVVEYVEKLKRFRSSIYWAGERFCRAEKAAKEGYSTQDEFFYSTTQLQILLSAYFTAGIESSPLKGRAESVTRSGDPAEGGGYLASMLDLECAFLKLSSDYKDRLWVRFGSLGDLSDESVVGLSQSEIIDRTGWHPEKLKDVLGVTRDQVRSRVNTAVTALQKELGGPNPWRMGGYSTAA